MQDLQQALKKHFGFDHFLDGQEETIRGVLDGRDTLVIMPTGSGKSVCFQLPALMLDGVSLVISPLIALMKDQVDALAAKGIPATCLNSSLDQGTLRQRMQGIRAGEYKLVYVAPERLHTEGFQSLLGQLSPSLIAVDEAHCISQWGHDFRPDYLRLKPVIARFPSARIMGLTATATPEVKDDIVQQLGLGKDPRTEPLVHIFGFERPNLEIHVRRVNSHVEKFSTVKDIIQQWKTGIVYCATRKQVEKAYAELKKAGVKVVQYHAGMNDTERSRSQDRFISKQADVAVATNAFGMGIDRDDVRFVIHWDIPGSLEAYYQEIGRAGRDGEDAHCELLYSFADVRTQEFFLEGANPPPDLVLRAWKAVKRKCSHGPATHSADEWTEIIGGTTNSMAVNTTMYLLERAGLLTRNIEAGARVYTYDVTGKEPGEALEEIVTGLAEKARRDRRKLDTIIRYANSAECRHRSLLAYFGETQELGTCTMCDNCSGRTAGATRAPQSEEEWVLVQKVLSGVARMQGRFGKARVAQMLIGSKAKPVLDAGLDRLPTHGILAGLSENTVKQFIDELTRDGSVAINEGEYPTVAITPRGMQVVRRQENPAINWPTQTGTGKSEGKTGKAVPVQPSGPENAAVFERLRTWRNNEARDRSVPAYVVMTDKTLHHLAAALPRTETELPSIWGLGPSKIKNFGTEILAVINAGLR